MSSLHTSSRMALPILLFLLVALLLTAHTTTAAFPWPLHQIHDTRVSPEAHIFAYPASGLSAPVSMGLVFHIPTVDLYSVLDDGRLPPHYYLTFHALTKNERAELVDRFALTCSIFGAGGTETQPSVATRGVDPESAASAANLVLHRFNYFSAGFYPKPEPGAALLPTHITIDCGYENLPVESFEKLKTLWERISFTWFIEGPAVDQRGARRAFVERLYGATFKSMGFSDAYTRPTAHTHELVPLFTDAPSWPSWSARLRPSFSGDDNDPVQRRWLSAYHKTFILDSNKVYEKMQVPSFLERYGGLIMNTFMVRIAAPELTPGESGIWSASWALYRAPSDRMGSGVVNETEFVQGGDLGACADWWSASAPAVAGGMLNLCVTTEDRNVEFLNNLSVRSKTDFILEVRLVLSLPMTAPYPETSSIAHYQDDHAFLPLPQMTLVYKVKDFFDTTSTTRSSAYRLFTTNTLVGNILNYPPITPGTIDRMFDVVPRNINTTKQMFTPHVPGNVNELLGAPFNVRMLTNWTNVDFASEFSFMPFSPGSELLYQPEGWVPLAQHTYKFHCSLIGRSADRIDPTTTTDNDHVMDISAIAMPYGREVSFSTIENTNWTKQYTHLELDCGAQLTFRRPSVEVEMVVVIQAGVAHRKTGQSGVFWLTGYGATPTPTPNPDPEPQPEPEPTPTGPAVSINSQLDRDHGVVNLHLVLNTTNLNGTVDVVDHLKMYLSSSYHFRVHNSKGAGPHSLPVMVDDNEPTFAAVTTTAVSMGDLQIAKNPHRLVTIKLPLLLVLKGDEDKQQQLVDSATAPTIRVVIPGFEVDETIITIETPTATKDYGQDDNNPDGDDKKKGGDSLKFWLMILLMVLIVVVIVAVVVKFIIVPIRRRRQALMMANMAVNSEYKDTYVDDGVL